MRKGDSVDAMKLYKQRGKVRNGAPTPETAMTPGGDIVLGKFVDRERPGYLDLMRAQLSEKLGEKFINEGVPVCL